MYMHAHTSTDCMTLGWFFPLIVLIIRGIFQPYAHCLKHAISPYEGGLCMHFTVSLNFELQSICYLRNWKFGSPSVTASTEKQGWKKKRGRTGEKEIKGWINSPTAASCSSPFWNICQRRKDRSRERENKWGRTYRKDKEERGENRKWSRDRKQMLSCSNFVCVCVCVCLVWWNVWKSLEVTF